MGLDIGEFRTLSPNSSVAAGAAGLARRAQPARCSCVAERLVVGGRQDVLGRLSDREREVLDLMGSNRSIAERLHVGGKTVETHIRSIFIKLDLEEAPEGHRRVRAVLHWLQG